MRNRKQLFIGAAAAISVVFFWAGWIVVSRFGVTNNLTVYDVAGFRFSVGAAVVLPYILWRRSWRGLTPLRVLALTLTCGVPYALLSYFGFTYAPAAHGGVFLNGCLPLFTALFGWIYIPIWWLWLDSNLAGASRSEILLQAAYQGLVPSVLGISCLNIAIRRLGANTTSVFLSAVPVVAALAAIPILQEMPGLPAWIGMITVSGGILLALGIVGMRQPAVFANQQN